MDLKAWRQLYGVSQIPMCLVQDNKVLLALPELAPLRLRLVFLNCARLIIGTMRRAKRGRF